MNLPVGRLDALLSGGHVRPSFVQVKSCGSSGLAAGPDFQAIKRTPNRDPPNAFTRLFRTAHSFKRRLARNEDTAKSTKARAFADA